MADDERILAAIRGADRYLNGWHGRPTMRERLLEIAEATAEDERPDGYGAGERIERLEARIAGIVGAEAAVFMPSGTMAQQIAMRIWSERRGCRTVAFHPTCHLEIHEQKGYQLLHGLHGRLVGDPNAADHAGRPRGDRRAGRRRCCSSFPQREIGGRLPEWDDLVAQTGWAREREIALHLDGARLWEVGPFYGRDHAEIAGLFDSVYVSFYKDLNAPGRGGAGRGRGARPRGARLAAQARRQPGHAAPVRGLGRAVARPAAGADPGLRRPRPRAGRGARARWTAIEVVPDPPQTPMFHLLLHGDRERLADAALTLAEERGVFLFGDPSTTTSPSVQLVEVMVGEPTLRLEPDEAAALLGEVVERASV